jgi:hypothetical protein
MQHIIHAVTSNQAGAVAGATGDNGARNVDVVRNFAMLRPNGLGEDEGVLTPTENGAISAN